MFAIDLAQAPFATGPAIAPNPRSDDPATKPSPVAWETFRHIERNKHLRDILLNRGGKPHHVLFAQQMSREMLTRLCTTAHAIRRLHKTDDGARWLRELLAGKRILNLFVQPSTRTVESFSAAADRLGMDSRVIQDMTTSSFAKGESVEDAIRTLSSYFDCIVTRHTDDDFALKAVWTMLNSNREIPVISGGSGSSQHVTQSLLDIYTLQYSFSNRGGMDGRTVMIVSDLARNRAARSLIYLLTKFENVRLVLVSPANYGLDDDLRAYVCDRHGMDVLEFTSVHEALKTHGKQLDAIYMTRNQAEYGGKTGWQDEDAHRLRWEDRCLLGNDTVILHPLPRQDELPTQWDNVSENVMWRQVRNGMWMRAALFASVFGRDEAIVNRAKVEGLF